MKKFKDIEGMGSEIAIVYKFVYNKKVLPSMRSMQFAGKPIEVNPSRVFNCAYLPVDDWRSFSEIMFWFWVIPLIIEILSRITEAFSYNFLFENSFISLLYVSIRILVFPWRNKIEFFTDSK